MVAIDPADAYQVANESVVDAVGNVAKICGSGCAGRDEAQASVWGLDIEAVDRDQVEVDVKIHGCAETLRERDGARLVLARRIVAVEGNLLDEDLQGLVLEFPVEGDYRSKLERQRKYPLSPARERAAAVTTPASEGRSSRFCPHSGRHLYVVYRSTKNPRWAGGVAVKVQ